jgi:flavin reductase (DIM6/NTAB) family NADH-FMN oxidoreductase RutF
MVGHDVNEFDIAGLSAVPSTLVRPPRVARSPVSLECVVTDIRHLPTDTPDGVGRMVMGRVLGIHIADAVLIDGRVSIALMRPIARLGYREYAVVDETFEMDRPA